MIPSEIEKVAKQAYDDGKALGWKEIIVTFSDPQYASALIDRHPTSVLSKVKGRMISPDGKVTALPIAKPVPGELVIQQWSKEMLWDALRSMGVPDVHATFHGLPFKEGHFWCIFFDKEKAHQFHMSRYTKNV